MFRGTVKDLIEKFNGISMSYSSLPLNAKNAVDVYFQDEFEHSILPNDIFGYVEIPLDSLKEIIGCPEDLKFDTFDEYHQWYMDGGDIPSHQDVWAIILFDDDKEVILDGWHRFHSYVEKNIETIPCVYPIEVFALKY